ncbi:MAG: hypothetical protein K2M46_11095 [Lachnospiraceae bacterium]|nr:hypothetical protein [Lachnospiraceae bacterium]
MKKEFKVGMRVIGLIIIMFPVLQGILTLYMAQESLNSINDTQVLREVVTNTLLYFPAMQIPMIATLLIQSVITEERKQKIVQVLFANGISPKKLWRSKILTGMSVSYILSFFGILIGIIYVRFVYHIWIDVNLNTMMYLMVVIPIVSMVFVNVICLLMWLSKKGQFFIGFIPSLSYIVCMYLSILQVQFHVNIDDRIFACIIILVSIIGMYMCDIIAQKVSKEYLVNIEA